MEAPTPPLDAGHLPRRLSKQARLYWRLLVYGLGASAFLGTLGRPRFFSEEYLESVRTLASSDEGFPSVFSKGFTYFLFAVAALGLVLGLRNRSVRRSASAICFAGLALCAATILSSFFGTVPAFSWTLVAIPAVLLSTYVAPSPSLDEFLALVRRALGGYVWVSVLAAVVAPAWAIEWAYDQSLIPGFGIRLHGAAAHANTLSAFLAFYLVIAWYQRPRGPIARMTTLVAAICLVLTQSKTAWGSALLAIAVIVYTRQALRSRGRRILARIGMFLVLSAAGGLVVLDASGFGSLSVSKDSSITTLTGRTVVWAATVALWAQNPVFGYGTKLWGPEMQERYASVLGWTPPHAHNQFFQTLGESGLVGVTALVAYVLVLAAFAIRTTRLTHGLTLALLLALCIRGITETPLRPLLTDGNLFLHFIVYTALVVAARQLRQGALATSPARHAPRRGARQPHGAIELPA